MNEDCFRFAHLCDFLRLLSPLPFLKKSRETARDEQRMSKGYANYKKCQFLRLVHVLVFTTTCWRRCPRPHTWSFSWTMIILSPENWERLLYILCIIFCHIEKIVYLCSVKEHKIYGKGKYSIVRLPDRLYHGRGEWQDTERVLPLPV